jgi:chemotaxis protein histidine kinase CheA
MRIRETFEALFAHLRHLEHKMDEILQQLNDLQAKVTNEETVEASAVTLLQGLKSSLDAALATQGDADAIKAAVQAISDKIGTDTDTLSAAVAENTPASASTDIPPADTSAPASQASVDALHDKVDALSTAAAGAAPASDPVDMTTQPVPDSATPPNAAVTDTGMAAA